MGASISGLLAILFMDKLEKQVVSSFPISIYARYIDDIFVLTTNREESLSILQSVNNLHPNIKFKIEHPSEDNSLSLLDFRIRIEHGKAEFQYYQKSAKKLLFVNFNSAIPTQQKMNIVRNESLRRTSRCTDENAKRECIREFENILTLND